MFLVDNKVSESSLAVDSPDVFLSLVLSICGSRGSTDYSAIAEALIEEDQQLSHYCLSYVKMIVLIISPKKNAAL